jgi:hypothetical protein
MAPPPDKHKGLVEGVRGRIVSGPGALGTLAVLAAMVVDYQLHGIIF